ncbi:uncharacterized protein LOC129277742 [Lytechinus pictus]|uniref:uncharacterized protein LOC129277742 n=1 Tax=Lytechinus pictus TaxID=7653 RepID=UPI00240D7848|nr:uncharacterized protein LOC129277742 isoform X1 [Lytechinus pictus]XP_054769870.1 uncharacterized protein LOC129277742 isoform X1 [Lytechinus pictus]XP_054769871.1 uncharacterized protein LOC129277742 isoform X2 [Lytechinus pictus]
MELSSIDTPVLVSACLLVLAFLIGCSRGRDTWIFVDFLATSAFGLGWYFIPDIILGFQINVTPDGTHLTYTRAFAACMIGDAVSRYFLRSSKDASTLVYLLFSRIVGCSVLIISMIYIQYFGGSVWNQNHIFFGMLGNMLWMMGSVVYYYQSRYSGGHAQLESRLNMHLRLDGFLTLLIGCSCYAFPDFYLKMQTTLETYDGAHLHMVRSTGALLIGSAMLSFVAPGFLFDWDKRALFIGRIVKVFVTVLAVLYAAAKYDAWGGNLHLYLLMEIIITLNSLLGYYAPHETERYKSN